MAAHPETPRVVQAVHDTVLAVVRDTVVRVAEPVHRPEGAVRFFGRMSGFEIIVAVVALTNALYTVYISFFQRARIALRLGDQVGVVLNPNDVGRKLHLRCNFANAAANMGTIQHLEAVVRGPQNFVQRFRWHLFYKYVGGGNAVQKVADVYPLAVAGRESHLEFIEFDAVGLAQGQRPPWVLGRYSVEVEGWINRQNRTQPPNLRTVCHFSVGATEASALQQSQPQQPNSFPFPVEEWETAR